MVRRLLPAVALLFVFACGSGESEKSGAVAVAPEPATFDPVSLSPETYSTLFENEYLRVLKISAAPGHRDPMHSHPASAVFAATATKLRLHSPDGTSTDVERSGGEAWVIDPVARHSMENLSDTATDLLMVELKGRKAAGTEGADPVAVSPEVYSVLAENDVIRVVNVRSKAGSKDRVHGHPTNIYYVVGDASGRLHAAGSAPTDVEFKAGSLRFQEPTAGHRLENTGKSDIHLVMFELKP